MTRVLSQISSSATRLLTVVLLLLSAAAPVLLHAAPAPSPSPRATAASATPLLGGSTVRFETTSTAVTPGGALGVTAKVRVGKPVDSLQARLQLYRPDGSLLYQKTQVPDGTASKTVEFRWDRTLSDLGLAPGRYPLVLTVNASRGGTPAERRIERSLLVYDPEHSVVPVAFIVRVATTPMTDASGKFVVDPGLETATRDATTALADAVLDTATLRLTVGVPPSTLREWKQISEGYEFVSGDASTKVPNTAAVPQEYKKSLDTIAQAIATGRFEFLGQPYSDPSLYALDGADLLGDIGQQYNVGLSAYFTAMESTPSAGTAPYRWLLPPDATRRMAAIDSEYVVIDPVCARASGGRPTTGPSRVKSAGLNVLVIDTPSSDALGSNETSVVVNRVFERQIGYQSKRPFVIGASLEASGPVTVESVLAATEAVSALPFTRLAIGSDVAGQNSGSNVTIVQRRVPDSAPDGYWNSVKAARSWSRAISGALKQGSPEAEASTSDTLLAEGSAWSGPNGTWGLAPSGAAFAKEGQRVAEDILGKVSLKIENVTLPGPKGEVPISVRNRSGRQLTVKLVARGDDLQVQGGSVREVTLAPSENFVKLPVDLKSAIKGNLTVDIVATPRTIATSTVTVQASYLDRLAIIGGVVLVLFVLLIFIVRRVRAAEARDEEYARRRAERYTGKTDQPEDADDPE